MNLETNLSYFSAGLFSSLAILCQQYYLAIPAGFITYMIYEIFIKKSFTKNKINNVLLFLLPLLIPLLLFYIWGGLTKLTSYEIEFSIWNITGILTVIGFWFLPFTIQKMKCVKLKVFIFIGILSLILGLFFKPLWSQYYGLLW